MNMKAHYIHRNPLRAGIASRLINYKWISYPIYAYARKGPDWLSTQVDIDKCVQAKGLHGIDKHKRDLIVYLLCNKGLMNNEKLR